MQLCSIREQVLANRHHAGNVDEQGGGFARMRSINLKRCVACLRMGKIATRGNELVRREGVA